MVFVIMYQDNSTPEKHHFCYSDVLGLESMKYFGRRDCVNDEKRQFNSRIHVSLLTLLFLFQVHGICSVEDRA
jgi:hypothetical protein